MNEAASSPDDVPEADRIEQLTPVGDLDAETDPDGDLLPTDVTITANADEADQLEQAMTVPLADDEHD
ncbi:MAG: hypothetical protein ACXVXW_11305 [Mycobacteriaceae bacterium]